MRPEATQESKGEKDKVSLSLIFTPSRNTYPPWNVYPSSASFVSSTSHRGSQKAQPSFCFDPETPPRPIETKTEKRERVRVVQNVKARWIRENKSKRWGRRLRWRRRKIGRERNRTTEEAPWYRCLGVSTAIFQLVLYKTMVSTEDR